jgi:hypothetical protein
LRVAWSRTSSSHEAKCLRDAFDGKKFSKSYG